MGGEYDARVLKIQQTEQGVEFGIKVVPNASRDQIAGFLGERLKIRVSALPESGMANKSVCALLAQALDIPNRNVSVIAGHTYPLKTVAVDGITHDAVLRAFTDS